MQLQTGKHLRRELCDDVRSAERQSDDSCLRPHLAMAVAPRK